MAVKKLTDEQKESLRIFRERRGGPNRRQQEANRRNREEAKAIAAGLAQGPMTVPELARKTNLPASRVLWHIAAMRKYGQAQDQGAEGDYVRYALVESDETKATDR